MYRGGSCVEGWQSTRKGRLVHSPRAHTEQSARIRRTVSVLDPRVNNAACYIRWRARPRTSWGGWNPTTLALFSWSCPTLLVEINLHARAVT